VGNVVEYDARLATVPCKRWEVTAADQDGSTTLECDGNIAYISVADGNLTKIVSKRGDTLVEFKPQSFGLSFPLETGKKWKGKYTGYAASTGASWDADSSCEVMAPEIVTVPAGQFDAYRIDCLINWTSAPFDGHSHSSTWYAPKVGTIVKSVSAENPEWDFEVTSLTAK